MGQFERKIISFEVTVTESFRQNKHNKLIISNSKVQMCGFITFCGFMIFVYIVRNLILQLKTILCISLIYIWFLVETYKKLLRLFLTYFAFFLKKPISLFSKFSFLKAAKYCTRYAGLQWLHCAKMRICIHHQ